MPEKHATANTGFFQEAPRLRNQVVDDWVYGRCVRSFLPAEIRRKQLPELEGLGQDVLHPQLFAWVTSSEHNLPRLLGDGRGSFGRPATRLATDEGWRRLGEWGLAKGMVAKGYEQPRGGREGDGAHQRTIQFLRTLLWEGTASNTPCPGAMQDGAARLLELLLEGRFGEVDDDTRRVLGQAFEKLVSGDAKGGWTSGQWMTERAGGSDVSKSETWATYDPQGGVAAGGEGKWRIDGHKWFTSGVDGDMTVLLAQVDAGDEKGNKKEKKLSAFYAPMYLPSAQQGAVDEQSIPKERRTLNGVRITRMKRKLGTKSLPTAEVEIENMRAHLLGTVGMGIQMVAPILTITRIHSAVAALGYVGRGLQIARAFSLVREVGGGKGRRMRLWKMGLHVRTLAGVMGRYWAGLGLMGFTTCVLGASERGMPKEAKMKVGSPGLKRMMPASKAEGEALLRVLAPVLKAKVCGMANPMMYSLMESLGGVGYLENSEDEEMNVSRLVRDCMVLSIWEGTTDVLSTDTVRALLHPRAGKDSLGMLERVVVAGLGSVRETPGGWGEECGSVEKKWEGIKERIAWGVKEGGGGYEVLLPEAREITLGIAEVLMLVLGLVDVAEDGDYEAGVMLRRVMREWGVMAQDRAEEGAEGHQRKDGWETDLKIVFGKQRAGELIAAGRSEKESAKL